MSRDVTDALPDDTPPPDARSEASAHPVAIVAAAVRLAGADDLEALAACLAGPPRPGPLADSDALDGRVAALSDAVAAQLPTGARLALETAARALREAGWWRGGPPRVGVFWAAPPGPFAPEQSPSLHAARLAWAADLRGPVVAVDAACAGGLAALVAAVDALRAGRLDGAVVVGGVGLSDGPGAAALGLTSASGRGAPFSQASDGLVRGEGAVALALAPWDGGACLGRVIGIGAAGPGRGAGVGAPRPSAHREAASAAWAGRPAPDWLELGGAGAPLADAVEIAGVTEAFPEVPARSARLHLGHLEHVAGLVGVAATVAAWRRGALTRGLPSDVLPGLAAIQPGPISTTTTAGVHGGGVAGTVVHVALAGPVGVPDHGTVPLHRVPRARAAQGAGPAAAVEARATPGSKSGSAPGATPGHDIALAGLPPSVRADLFAPGHLEAALVALLSSVVGRPVQVDAPLAWQGVDSLGFIAVRVRLAEALGVEVTADDLAEVGTVTELAARIRARRGGAEDRVAWRTGMAAVVVGVVGLAWWLWGLG